MLSDKLISLFWAKVDKNGPVPAHVPDLGPCWLWTGKLSEKGYGLFTRKCLRTHRVSWEVHVGKPPSMSVLHKCDTRACLRPDHLFEGDQVANLRDMRDKGRGAVPEPRRGLLNYQVRLTEPQVAALRAEFLDGGKQYDLAARYGISQSTVSRYVAGLRRPIRRRYTDRDGERNKRSKLKACDVTEIRFSLARSERMKAIAERFGVSISAISAIATGKRWKTHAVGILGPSDAAVSAVSGA